MRRRLAPFWIALALSATGAARAELLASFEATAQGTDTGHAYFDFADVDLVIGDDLVRLFNDVALGPTEIPVLYEATAASDPDFETAAALFTNGEPEEFVIELTGASGGGLGVGTNDCALFHDDYDCVLGVDLQGGSIDRITLEVRRLSLVALDPFGTAIEFDVALEVFGVPEPAAAPGGLAAAVALGVALLGRRSP
jgi:hypothetical protein